MLELIRIEFPKISMQKLDDMTKIVFVVLVLLLGCTEHLPKQSLLPSGSKVLILGDSLSYGTGANPGQDYPSLLTQTTGWNIVNAGVPGDTSAGGLQRLEGLLASHTPALVVIELGGNDFLRQLPIDITESNLRSALSMAKASGAKVLLVSIPEFSPLRAVVGNLSDHPVYERIAQDTNTPLISDVFSEVLSDRSLRADQIHPNAQGYSAVATKMHEALRDLGYVR